MNDMSPWEKQLESWTPRRPSARLEQALFGADRADRSKGKAAPSRARTLRSPMLWAWLAPATCLLVLTFSVNVALVRQDRPSYLTASSSNMIASLVAPQSLMEFSPDTRAQENIWAVATSDRSVGRSLNATSSFSLWKTNLHF
jgi:hypothetical protein